MLAWLKAGQARFPTLSLKYYSVDYRGVHLNRRVERDTCVLEVPLDMIMTTAKAKQCELGLAISNSRAQVHSSHSWLAAMLLQERANPNSKWKPYIDCLPRHYRNMPLFFDQDELDELKGSLTIEMIENRKISMKYEYDAIAKHCPEFAKYRLVYFHFSPFIWSLIFPSLSLSLSLAMCECVCNYIVLMNMY